MRVNQPHAAIRHFFLTGAVVLGTQGTGLGQDAPQPDAGTNRNGAAPGAPEEVPPQGDYGIIDDGYYDEPPLDLLERQWRYRTRQFQPQRFSRRDLRRRYGYQPPYSYWGGFGRGFAYPGGIGFEEDAYLQGRHDQRRFTQWQEHHDKNRAAYRAAMAEGIQHFRETAYDEALMAFIRAARLNQGDPASRLHATYAMVAIGNYEDAALLLRRALQLQPRIVDLPLSIRGEYGVDVDFDAHLRRLVSYVDEKRGDAAMLTLEAYYWYFSGDRQRAYALLSTARQIAPADEVIDEFHKAARFLTPSRRESPTDE